MRFSGAKTVPPDVISVPDVLNWMSRNRTYETINVMKDVHNVAGSADGFFYFPSDEDAGHDHVD